MEVKQGLFESALLFMEVLLLEVLQVLLVLLVIQVLQVLLFLLFLQVLLLLLLLLLLLCFSGLPLFVVIKCGSGPAEAVSLSMDIDRDRMTGNLHPKWQDLENWNLMERFLFSHKTMMRKRGENPYSIFKSRHAKTTLGSLVVNRPSPC